MSDHDAPEGRAAGGGPLIRSPWDVFTQGLPSDPRGKYFRLLADPRPEEVAAVASAVQALEHELLRLAETAAERRTAGSSCANACCSNACLAFGQKYQMAS